jgi:putative DNA primase/helicase
MLDSALSYAALGFHIFPCCWPTATGSCGCGRNHKGRDIGKVPLTPKGFYDGTNDIERINKWWIKWPNANIGWWPTGHIVLDEDNKKDNNGAESIAKLQQEYGPLPATLINLSGSHLGHHYIFKNSNDKEIGNVNMTKRYPGIDIRADKGYILLPPSLHITGWRYEVQDDLPIVDAPTWLVTLLLSEKRSVK